MTDEDLVVTAYKIGIKRQVVNALKPVFGPDFPMEDFANDLYIGLEYPSTALHYPGIYITYTEEELRNVGIGHYEQGVNDDGEPYLRLHWKFSGIIHFNIVALNPLDRDRLSSAMINIIGFGQLVEAFKPFYERLYNNKYVSITFLYERIMPEGEQNAMDVPWENADEKAFANSYGVPVHGEFVSHGETGAIVEIESVKVDPYLEGDPPPWTG